MPDDLDPRDFEDTANSVMTACNEAADFTARQTLLAESGLLGVLAPEECGGLGLPMQFAVPIAKAAGDGLLAFPLIEAMVLSKALAGAAPELVASICSGEALVTIAWSGRVEGGCLGNAPLAHEASHVLALRGNGGAVLLVRSNFDVIEFAADLDLDVPEATLAVSASATGIELDAATVAALHVDAQVLRTAFIHGSASRCLTLAAEYAQDRSQFGKLLSANQALRHRMSRDAVVVETLGNALTRSLKGPAEGEDIARESLWSWAAVQGPSVAESAIQVFGGMGFTWDVPLHRYLRRMKTLAYQGRAAEVLEKIGEGVIAGKTNSWYQEIADVV